MNRLGHRLRRCARLHRHEAAFDQTAEPGVLALGRYELAVGPDVPPGKVTLRYLLYDAAGRWPPDDLEDTLTWKVLSGLSDDVSFESRPDGPAIRVLKVPATGLPDFQDYEEHRQDARYGSEPEYSPQVEGKQGKTGGRHERTDNGPGMVHGAVKAKGLPLHPDIDGIGNERIPWGGAYPLADPVGETDAEDGQGGRRRGDERPGQRGRRAWRRRRS